ncbi:RimK family alpha-L-glutamate ligase [Streptomyces sp. NPDC002701]|uniref:RimK family alpha-L-glutamate ligase n=1 Tax=Streptomyces sp. NPDC002701 TaxID=3364661 RepID=UPI0036BD2472
MSVDDFPLAVLASRIRLEEKLILAELERRRVPYEILDTRTTVFGPGNDFRFRGALTREIGHTRNLYATRLLEHAGLRVVNSSAILSVCGDKLLTTLELEKAGLPVPRWMTTVTPQGALPVMADFGYPAVIKPVIGSWGRLMARVDGHDAAEAVLEHREALPGPVSQITYVQEYIDKPGREIKAYVMGGETVGVIYKSSDEWRTNTKRGGVPSVCTPDDELRKLLAATAEAIGDGVLGIDVLEDRSGAYYVNEVNHTPEFHGAVEVLGTDLVGRYVDHVLSRTGGSDA